MRDPNLTLPPGLEQALTDYYAAPQPDPAFADRLERQLVAQVSDLRAQISDLRHAPRRTFMQTLRARPALAILFVLLALALLTGAAYAIGRLSGYLPGFGFVQDAHQVQILDAPAAAPWDDLTLEIVNAFGDETRFWVQATLSRAPHPQALYDAQISLPGGETLTLQQSSWSDEADGRVRLLFQFPPLPAGVSAFTLYVRYAPVMDALPDDSAWRSISLPLTLRPLRAEELIPALPTLPDFPPVPLLSETHSGLTLALENIAPASDKTVLQVALRYSQPNTNLNSDWNVTLRDLEGRVYPLVNITPDVFDGRTKTYETAPFKGGEMLILSLTAFPDPHALPLSEDFSLNGPAFTFDPGPNPQVGQVWTLDETLQAGAFSLHLVGAQAVSSSEIVFLFEPTEPLSGVMLYSTASSGAGGETIARDDLINAPVRFGSLPKQPIKLAVMRVYYTARGNWQILWRAPAAPTGVTAGPSPTPAPTAGTFPTPTPLVSGDPLLLEVQALSQKFDAPLRQGPGWVHVLTETETRPQAGQTFPLPYITTEQWLELDAEGYVIRALWTDRDKDGNVLQQSVTIGNYSLNFTTGDAVYNEYGRYPFSMDILMPILNSAAQYGATVTREETHCDDGAPCLLVTLTEMFTTPIQNPGESVAFSGAYSKIWIDRHSGLQRQQQSGWILPDGALRLNATYRVLRVEKAAPPPEVLDLLSKVILP